MKKLELICIAFVLLITGVFSSAVAAESETAPEFTVSALVVSGSVENLEPVGIVSAFSSSTEKVYCFLEATDIRNNTDVSFVWYHEDTEKARIILPLRQGKRWRTYSSKKLFGLKGVWRVDLEDSAGSVKRSTSFTVE